MVFKPDDDRHIRSGKPPARSVPKKDVFEKEDANRYELDYDELYRTPAA